MNEDANMKDNLELCYTQILEGLQSEDENKKILGVVACGTLKSMVCILRTYFDRTTIKKHHEAETSNP